MNKVILIGNLTKDVELKVTPQGTPVATCSIATSESYKDKNTGEKKEIVQFTNLVIWAKPAEIFAKYLSKGKKVGIIGKLQTRNYMAQDNTKRYVTEVIVNEFEFLSPSGQSNQSGEYSQPDPVDSSMQDIPGEDEIRVENIPF